MYKYKFSVIIPIYNVEDYLKDAIDSVINQSIGFLENVQLILVNDGSKDNSESICMEYKEKYPENIIYIKQENSGVSSARNTGIEYINGKYVNFLDGDDKWNLDVFEKVWNFFENNDVQVVACRRKFFEARDDYHALDYVFEEDRVIDITKDYQFIHLHAASTFFESEIAKKFRFDANLKYGEDAKYVTEIILETKKFGALRNAEYNYRKRINETSILQKSFSDIRWYNETIQNFHKQIIQKSIEKEGKIIPYIQYIIMYDLKGRISKEYPEFMNDTQKAEYKELLLQLIKQIDDNIICNQKKFYATDKIFVLSLKYGRDIVNELVFKDEKLYFNDLSILSIKNNKSICTPENLMILKKKIYIDGNLKLPIPKGLYEIYVENNGKKYCLTVTEEENEDDIEKKIFYIGRKKKYKFRFKTVIELEKQNKISFVFKYKDDKTNILSINSDDINFSYNKRKYKHKISDKEIIVKKITNKLYRLLTKISHKKMIDY